MVRIAKVLLMPSSNAGAGVHHEVADAREQVLEEAQVRPISTIMPIGASRRLGEVRIGVRPARRCATSHQVRTASPAMDSATPVARWRIETSHVRSPPPDRQVRRERAWIGGDAFVPWMRACRLRRRPSRGKFRDGRLTRVLTIRARKSSRPSRDKRMTESGRMSGETGQLQRLTDEQVKRAAGRLQCRRFARPRHRAAARQCRRHHRRRDHRASSGRSAPSAMRQSIRARSTPTGSRASPNMAARSIASKTSVPSTSPPATQAASRIVGRIVERFAERSATCSSDASRAFQRLTTFETDIILAQVSLLEAIEAAELRGRESEQFERRVAELVRASTDQSKALTDRTRSTAASARGMLGKTSEVAAAAEQSAVAMREAAQTAAGPHPRDRGCARPRSRSPPASPPAPATRRARR